MRTCSIMTHTNSQDLLIPERTLCACMNAYMHTCSVVCINVFMHEYTHVCMHSCMCCVCMYGCMYECMCCMCECTNVCVYGWMYLLCMHASVMYIRTHSCMYVYSVHCASIYIFTHTLTNTRTASHTHLRGSNGTISCFCAFLWTPASNGILAS
jgi:hypothetical protein